jgi:hypothetical protein
MQQIIIMKNFILLILFIGFNQTIKAIEIENIAVSAISNQEINIRVNTMDLYTYSYASYQYNIVGNTITLEICYNPGIGAAISYLENNIQIPINTTNVANYLLSVKVYYINLQNFNCDYQILRDIKNLTFSTPLSGTVLLTIKDDTQNKITSILYPNPTTGILFRNKNMKIDRIQVYDFKGLLIYEIENPENEFDLSNLQNGIYLVRIEKEKESYFEKIILKK